MGPLFPRMMGTRLLYYAYGPLCILVGVGTNASVCDESHKTHVCAAVIGLTGLYASVKFNL